MSEQENLKHAFLTRWTHTSHRNITHSDLYISGAVSAAENEKASYAISELQRLLNHNPNKTSNSFENNDDKNETKSKSYWYNVNSDLLTSLYKVSRAYYNF